MSTVIAHVKDDYTIRKHEGGNITVEVRKYYGEHHSTLRSIALKAVRAELGSSWAIGSYLGPTYRLPSSGDPTPQRGVQFSAVNVA